MKKALSICLLLLCLLPLPAQAAQHLSAPAPVQTHWVGEYQLFQQLHQLPPSALQARGLSPQAASALTGHSFEELLLERARLPAPVLAKYGYTSEQIALLRSYDGSSLQEQPRFFGAVARLQVEVRCGAVSPQSIQAQFSWRWTSPPLLCYQDLLACSYTAESSDGTPTRAETREAVCSVEYRASDGSLRTASLPVQRPGANMLTVQIESPAALSQFPLSGRLDVTAGAPYSGQSLDSVSFSFAYGHSTTLWEPSVTASEGSFSFPATVPVMYQGWAEIAATGDMETHTTWIREGGITMAEILYYISLLGFYPALLYIPIGLTKQMKKVQKGESTTENTALLVLCFLIVGLWFRMILIQAF